MDLSTDYLGLQLRNPLVASASPLSRTVDGVRRLADSGVGAIVLFSLFEEQLRQAEAEQARLVAVGAESSPESTSYFPPGAADPAGPHAYLNLIERAAVAVEVPVIGSLNGSSPGGWARHARGMQDAGAAAIELNIYSGPGSPGLAGREIEQRHVDILAAVKAAVTVPVAVKLSPYFTSVGDVAVALDRAGASGLVLFNRFLQPDIDPETLAVVPTLDLSSPADARLPRTWIAILRHQVHGSLAATTGVDSAADVAAYLLAGADVVMTTSALLRYGLSHVSTLLDGLADWMIRKQYGTVADVRAALSVPAGATAADGQNGRAGYLAVLATARQTYSLRHGFGAW